MKILVVEDEVRIAEALKTGLEQEAYAVDLAFDGLDGFNSAESDDYDLIILDLMLPEMNGIEVCQKLRAEGHQTPILMLTAKSEVEDIVKGLDVGADDYLAKPFSFDVLLARIRALLRRPRETQGEILMAGGGQITLDPATKEVKRSGELVDLSAKEYALLEYLMRNKGRVMSKNNIINHVWNFDSDVLPNNVEVFVAYLRAKIDKPFPKQPKIIQTVRGFGYKVDS